MDLPHVKLITGHDRRLRAGHPWVYSNEIKMDEAAKALPPGSVVTITDADGKPFALAHFNPHSLIAGRVLTRTKTATIDTAFLERRLARALRLRERLFGKPYYRLAHGEADGVPGLVVDRYGDVLVAQLNSAGMDALSGAVVEALNRVVGPRAIVFRNDGPVRELEGLAQSVDVVHGETGPRLTLEESGVTFEVDVIEGQKTGWFYDQRANRAFAARLAREARVLDLYSYGGGFGLIAAASGAREVLAIDRSSLPLELAAASAARNGFEDRLETRRDDAFTALDHLARDKARFELVIADPPSFVRNKRELQTGLRGYRKLARLAAPLVTEEGFLAIASCSHNVPADQFAAEVRRGLRDAGRGSRLIHEAGAGPDHPVHPVLPESSYLTFLVYQID